MKITESQKRKMLHALGLDYNDESYRNRYVLHENSEGHEELIDLVKKGLMVKRIIWKTEHVYFVTEKGAKFLGVKLPVE